MSQPAALVVIALALATEKIANTKLMIAQEILACFESCGVLLAGREYANMPRRVNGSDTVDTNHPNPKVLPA
jgi:hypothetical protein